MFLYIFFNWPTEETFMKLKQLFSFVVIASALPLLGSAVVYSPNGKFAAQVNYKASTVEVFDAKTGEQVGKFITSPMPDSAQFSADGKYLYVTTQGGVFHNRYEVDQKTGAIKPG